MPGCSVSSRDFLGLAVRRAGHEIEVAVDGGVSVRDVAAMLHVSERRAA